MKTREYRREFHKFPENSWEEFRTSARIYEILDDLGCPKILAGPDVINEESIIPQVRLSEGQKNELILKAINQGAKAEYVSRLNRCPGVMAVFEFDEEGPVTAFRFDIDSLPYDEESKPGNKAYDEGFLSQNPKAVHACGHDGHTAIGLQLAEEIMKNKDKLKGKIKLIFQPAEETYSGAQSVVDKGHLDDVDNMIILHMALTAEGKPLPSNTIGCGAKDFLSDCQFDAYFEGEAAHPCGASQNGKNALLAACSATLNIHTIAPHEEGLFRVNVGELHGGVVVNTIAPTAMLKVEYRGESQEISAYGRKRVLEILEGAAKMHDCTLRIDDYGEIPAGKSDDEMMEVVERAAKKVDWFKKIYFECNVGGSDDGSIMLTKVQENGGKGSYIGIGTDLKGGVHSPEYDMDEAALDPSVELCMNILMELQAREDCN